jgi:hypothetical protein
VLSIKSLAEDFVDRFAQRENNYNAKKQGIEILSKVHELSKNALSDTESKALLLIVKYLEAKKIS